ncbi:hypothetical protein ACJ3XI_04900 [Litorimonas sp. RW-G-Af-16]|uniref:hypothetical protein n=1 Tax=Litorimonas sp. RW-G-Af-16 TaxID=3241168 RepID=UPI00390CD012
MNGQSHIHQTQPATRQWYIQVDAQAYGPFTDQILWQYMCEGRVTAQSLISQNPTQDFRPVSADPSLMNWLSQTPDNQQKNAEPAAPQPTAKKSVFMVMAEIRSGKGMDFLRTLQGLGQVERIGDTLWLLQAAATADELRNILSQPLNADDRLFILDSFENRMSWFNIGADMDRRVQALWDIDR